MTRGHDEKLLYDTGHAPLFVRIIALGLCAVSALIFVNELLELSGYRKIIEGMHGDHPVALLLAMLGMFLFFSQILGGQKRIFWNSTLNELIVADRTWFWITKDRYPVSDIQAIQICYGRTPATGSSWKISILHTNGKSNWLTQANSEGDAQSIASDISFAIEKDVIVA